ncbi:unnamed protein product [Thelazia callipaeda]|uniref:HintN domain-containing protein n=1 Tax=Thelazia callipaeda TaxID=103827 RepID=A0A0N5CVU9_THECL|nr:unnamed protein product [Thelazia callipaeda]
MNRAISSHQQSTIDSSCNEYTLPLSFENDKFGNPILSCSSLSCFGEKRFNELERGELIPGSRIKTKGLSDVESHNSKTRCYKFYENNSCTSETQWTAGIYLEEDGNNVKAKWKCCSNEDMQYSIALKTVIVKIGQRYKGGEVYQNRRRVAFDLIKEINVSYDENHRPCYELKIVRLACVSKSSSIKKKSVANENRETDALVKDISSEFDAEEYISANLHRAKYSKPNSRFTILGDENMDNFYHPRHRISQRRMLSFRRRPFYKPILDEYDYYDYDPVIFRRPSGHRRIITNDGLWPINLGTVGHSRSIVASGGSPSSLNEIASSNTVDNSDYHQFVDSDSVAVSVTSFPSESYNQPSFVNEYNVGARYQPTQIEVQPATGQVPYPNVQYPPQRTIIQTEPKPSAVIQRPIPTYSGTVPYYNGYFETLQCFSGDVTVQTPDRIKRIDELKVGDQVLSIDESLISFSPVVIFLHRSSNESAVFNKIILKTGEMVKLTDYHLLYVTDCKAGEKLRLTYAKDVHLGQCLHVFNETFNNLVPIQIFEILRVTDQGIYAPLTATGDIIVNSILSSCHSNVIAQTLQQSIFSLLRKFRSSLFTKESTIGLLPGIEFLTKISDIFLPQSFTA